MPCYVFLNVNGCLIRPCGGTSHFGSGTLGLFKPIAERNMIMYSIKLYRQLEAKGYDIGMLLSHKSFFRLFLCTCIKFKYPFRFETMR